MSACACVGVCVCVCVCVLTNVCVCNYRCVLYYSVDFLAYATHSLAFGAVMLFSTQHNSTLPTTATQVESTSLKKQNNKEDTKKHLQRCLAPRAGEHQEVNLHLCTVVVSLPGHLEIEGVRGGGS